MTTITEPISHRTHSTPATFHVIGHQLLKRRFSDSTKEENVIDEGKGESPLVLYQVCRQFSLKPEVNLNKKATAHKSLKSYFKYNKNGQVRN